MADGDEFESPLDELFVEGAQYHEPSARERAAWARETRRRVSRQKRARRRAAVRSNLGGRYRGVVILVVILAAAFGVSYLTNRGGDDGETTAATNADAPDRVRVVYALPAGTEADPAMEQALRNEVEIVQDWFAERTGGRRLDIVAGGDAIAVDQRDLAVSAADLAARGDASGLVADEFGADAEERPDEVVLAFVPVTFESLERCGEGRSDGLAVIWIGACDAEPSATSTEPSWLTITIAHELLHVMGAVERCAPHYGRNGHVTDDPTDIMYDGDAADPAPAAIELDPGNDDYFGHDMSSCRDTADHPLWD